MRRTYAARRLLEHGPLTFGEISEITRWPHGSVKAALANLQASGLVTSKRATGKTRTNVYELNPTHTARVRAFAEGA